MTTHTHVDANVAILTTRIPEGWTVPGLEYGALVSRTGGMWRHVRPEGARDWGLCRETPASDELPGDDAAILEAIRDELGAGADGVHVHDDRADQVAVVLAAADALWPAGGELFDVMLEPWAPGDRRDGLMVIADQLGGDVDALRLQPEPRTVRALVEADEAAGRLMQRLTDEGRRGEAASVARVRDRIAGALFSPAVERGEGTA